MPLEKSFFLPAISTSMLKREKSFEKLLKFFPPATFSHENIKVHKWKTNINFVWSRNGFVGEKRDNFALVELKLSFLHFITKPLSFNPHIYVQFCRKSSALFREKKKGKNIFIVCCGAAKGFHGNFMINGVGRTQNILIWSSCVGEKWETKDNKCWKSWWKMRSSALWKLEGSKLQIFLKKFRQFQICSTTKKLNVLKKK